MKLPSPYEPVIEETLHFDETDDPGISEIEARLRMSSLSLLDPASPRPHHIKLEGDVRFVLTATCARCLVQTSRSLRTTFTTLFDMEANTTEAADLETPPEEGGFKRLGDHQIDPTEEIRQRICLAVPDVVYCRDDCRGLCPRCGADLNAGDCGCDRLPEGNPFAVLAGKFQDKGTR
ncbi:MAG: DUF177 domain-containing protein [Candidatus Hydrogenedentota bacterium]